MNIARSEEAHSHRQQENILPVPKGGGPPPFDQDWISECEETLRDHAALCRVTEKALGELFNGDPLLRDIPADVSAEEVEAQNLQKSRQRLVSSHQKSASISELSATSLTGSGGLLTRHVLLAVALLNGQAITVHVERERLPTLKVIIPGPGTTVSDLKKAVRRTFELQQHRDTKNTKGIGGSTGKLNTKISWRYIWRTYLLSHEKQPLFDDSQSLSHYGIANKSSIRFVKRSKVCRLRGKR